MKILVDENIPRMTVTALQKLGHEVNDIRGSGKQGVTDAALWAIALNDGRLLITTDKGFARHRRDVHFGILIVRLRQPNRNKIHACVMRAMSDFGDDWRRRLVVMRNRTQSVSRSESQTE
jgi:predicted nuclease of predicted toxin-antitoxin system